jgi:hypothetical protein
VQLDRPRNQWAPLDLWSRGAHYDSLRLEAARIAPRAAEVDRAVGNDEAVAFPSIQPTT